MGDRANYQPSQNCEAILDSISTYFEQGESDQLADDLAYLIEEMITMREALGMDNSSILSGVPEHLKVSIPRGSLAEVSKKFCDKWGVRKPQEATSAHLEAEEEWSDLIKDHDLDKAKMKKPRGRPRKEEAVSSLS